MINKNKNMYLSGLQKDYQKNQEYLDKAILTIILALPPFLVIIFNKCLETNSSLELKYVFLTVLALSFIIITLYLIAFWIAKNVCIGKFNIRAIKIAEVLEVIYFILVIIVFVGIFAGFYICLIN